MIQLLHGDALTQLRTLPDASVHCCVTSPPYYGLRCYKTNPVTWPDGWVGELGQEPTPEMFISHLATIFREVRRVLRDDGTLWINIGDSYANDGKWGGSSGGKHVTALHGNTGIGRYRKNTGLKPKDLIGIPWMFAFALRADGWWLRQDIIWQKLNPLPESVKDRCTKSHEYIFMLSKSARYHYDAAAVAEETLSNELKKFTDNGKDKQRGHGRRHAGFNGRYAEKLQRDGIPSTRNRRSVWTIATHPTPEAHFATYPIDLPETCILAGCPEGGTVLDPFNGAGTTGLAAIKTGRNYIGIELNAEYLTITRNRFQKYYPLLAVEDVA